MAPRLLPPLDNPQQGFLPSTTTSTTSSLFLCRSLHLTEHLLSPTQRSPTYIAGTLLKLPWQQLAPTLHQQFPAHPNKCSTSTLLLPWLLPSFLPAR